MRLILSIVMMVALVIILLSVVEFWYFFGYGDKVPAFVSAFSALLSAVGAGASYHHLKEN